MVLVLRLGKPPREVAGPVVVDIGERGDAEAAAFLVELLARLDVAQDVPQRLRTAGIAALSHVVVERRREIVFDRQGDPLHSKALRLPFNRQYAESTKDAYEIVPQYRPACRRRRGTGANGRSLWSGHRRLPRAAGHPRRRAALVGGRADRRGERETHLRRDAQHPAPGATGRSAGGRSRPGRDAA